VVGIDRDDRVRHLVAGGLEMDALAAVASIADRSILSPGAKSTI